MTIDNPKNHCDEDNFTKLFRFEIDEEIRIDTLENRQIWMALPISFNDPFDCDLKIRNNPAMGFEENWVKEAAKKIYQGLAKSNLPYIFDETIQEKVVKWADGSLPNAGSHPTKYPFVSDIEKRIKSFGVQCFSTTMDHPLMWSHYASKHTGFCIEYGYKPMTLALQNDRLFDMLPVSYISILPDFDLNEVLFAPASTAKRLLATKSIEWAYEQEFRLIYYNCSPSKDKKGEKVSLPKGLEIKAIYTGINCDPKTIRRLKAIAPQLKIECYEMKVDERSYRLQPKKPISA